MSEKENKPKSKINLQAIFESIDDLSKRIGYIEIKLSNIDAGIQATNLNRDVINVISEGFQNLNAIVESKSNQNQNKPYQSNGNENATEKQLSYLKRLCLAFNEGIIKKEASLLIDKNKNKVASQ